MAEYWSRGGVSTGEDDSPTAAWVVARLTDGEQGVARLLGLIWRELEGVRALVDEHPSDGARQSFVEARRHAELARHARASEVALDRVARLVHERMGLPTTPAARSNFGVTVRRCFSLAGTDDAPTLVPEPMVSPAQLQRERAALLEAVQGYEPERSYSSLAAAWAGSSDPRTLLLAAAAELEDYAVRRSVVAVTQASISTAISSRRTS